MENSGIYADTEVKILGKFQNEEFQSYKFHKVEVSSITVDIEKSSFKLHGQITMFRDDETYGKGFKGELDIKFKRIKDSRESKSTFC
ncbi:MAG: hypothetical protein HC854_01920 [Flavobacterium sp.]|nr:hypothetical protein [Flavobacterium sp.]